MNLNVGRWWREHSLKLLAIRDTPKAIAGGVGIGVFFGFTPLFGLKTLTAIFVAWLTRSNILAAVLAATAHDVFLPFMPVIYRLEYDVGYWLLSQPHQWPRSLLKLELNSHSWLEWLKILLTAGRPLLLGSAVCAAPCALGCYWVTEVLVKRHHDRRSAKLQVRTSNEAENSKLES